MKSIAILFLIGLITASCSSHKFSTVLDYGSPKVPQTLYDLYTFQIDKYSEDPTYGYTTKNPIMVGGALEGSGPSNQRRFLNALTGPEGEEIEYYRLGSCCHFNTKNSEFGGLLDRYSVSYEGSRRNIILYINMYDSDTLKVPVGLKLRY